MASNVDLQQNPAGTILSPCRPEKANEESANHGAGATTRAAAAVTDSGAPRVQTVDSSSASCQSTPVEDRAACFAGQLREGSCGTGRKDVNCAQFRVNTAEAALIRDTDSPVHLPDAGEQESVIESGNLRAAVDGGGSDIQAEGMTPTGSDRSPPVESRSIDSLESFSNLNSCPSSDLTSEGAEDRVLALALQNDEYDGAKLAAAAPGRDRFTGQSVYHIKWIKWKDENTPIITQNENGPCPLLAIMNVLLLSWKVKMPPMMEIITAEQLMEYLGDYILDAKPKEISEAQRLNYEQNMSDAMAVLHKLQTGLDVNVRFTGVRVFEYTPECIVFDLLDIPLYHGWLVDPQTDDIVKAVGSCSYNQLVEKIIFCKQSDSSELVGEGFVAEQFLSNTATQLTYHGLCELTSTVQEGELCVFFRNNHFSTMTKHKGQLYLLVTDQGFLTEEKVVWESLHNVDGDGNFCDSEFHLRPPSDPETVYKGQQDQIDQMQQGQQPAPGGTVAPSATAANSPGKPSGSTERKPKKEAKEKEKERCVLL
ncbi:ubiquitin carboxyl-terminal hydrolase MINDY-2 isoform X3 [Polypterus senegalus]|uniref:ubiquitin carboxyl-terminal hydrolase MINDY-2 isoform X3 n=1 Tax=Polypterus senegalus TaxID=55291 RepID=UPI001964F715|nr:ubiquitin carboxyl-terminal hydrolase MINDY-2 isoform X3 [Polypterus senegalus]